MKPFSVYISEQQRIELVDNINDIITSGQFVLGEYTEQLENLISSDMRKFGAKLVSSGTVALEAVFEFLKKRDGKHNVAVQSNTNFATVSSIMRSGLNPILIDCDYMGQMCLDDLKSKASKYGFKTVAIVHIGGYCSRNLKDIIEYVKINNLTLIEDCAHSHGAYFSGQALGTFGEASILSFFPTKLVNGGEGGAVISENSELIEFVHKWRNQGKGGVYGNHHEVLGGSYRMPEINCSIALQYYKILNQEISKRRELYEIMLGELNPKVQLNQISHMDQCSFYKVILRYPGFAGSIFEERLREVEIFCGGGVYRSPIHAQPVFDEISAGTEALRITNEFCDEHFCPPLHSNITKAQMIQICAEINKIVGELSENG